MPFSTVMMYSNKVLLRVRHTCRCYKKTDYMLKVMYLKTVLNKWVSRAISLITVLKSTQSPSNYINNTVQRMDFMAEGGPLALLCTLVYFVPLLSRLNLFDGCTNCCITYFDYSEK
ncbi:hypothetical protein K501DRAFT_279138 [Backusella circina FSU 941]|nr:hypothetical protein K501DRAFT_279138 [Backusella circina FSU 941]